MEEYEIVPYIRRVEPIVYITDKKRESPKSFRENIFPKEDSHLGKFLDVWA
jgi:hypothetical protein